MKDFERYKYREGEYGIVLTYITDHGGAIVDQQTPVSPGYVGVGDRGDGAHQGHVLALDDLLVDGGGRHAGGAGQLCQGEVLKYILLFSVLQSSTIYLDKCACS